MAETLEVQAGADNPAVAPEYAPGDLAPAIMTTSRVWKPEDLKKQNMIGVIEDLVRTVSNTDEAARRFQVLQTWEMRHIDRGYQYLENDGGGWRIAGTDGGKTRNAVAAADDAGLYATNIFSAQGDIAIGALNRGKIKVNFAPRRSKNPRDVAAADAANRYKYLWEKNNRCLQAEIMNLGWTDCRVLTWTRSVADRRFGVSDDGTPRTVELSTAHGVLETKLPMMVDTLSECSSAQIFAEIDYAIGRAMYPWMGSKIKPSQGTYGELEFERIARINTRIGMIGKYITGTSGLRETTFSYNWFRPGMFYDDKVDLPTNNEGNAGSEKREFLLSNFGNGLFVIMAGTEFCCCWEESMDDHVSLGMFKRGFGQNRRSMGSGDLPIQKRINIWADLWDKYIRTSIPSTVLHDQAFDAEAVSSLEASPGRYIPVTPPEGMSIADTVGQTPVAQPIPGMAEMFQWYVGPLIQSIDGATPALFGGGEGQDNTVGATQIRLNQALERFGPPWIMANEVMARAARQAAMCCAENGNSEVSDTVNGMGDVSVNPADLRGEFECSPETLGSIPESGAQREAKIMQVLDMAQANAQVASIVATPANAREIVRALHIDDVLTVDEANSEDKQLEEIEVMLESAPLLNPQWQQMQQQIEALDQAHEQAKVVATQNLGAGIPPPPEAIQQGLRMEQQLQQMQQQFQQIPQYLTSVPVAQDESEDHQTEAATCFAWMQEPDGRACRAKSAKEQPGGSLEESPNWCKWTNVYLHWQGHKEMAGKFAPAKAPPPRVSLTGKLSPEQQAQLMGQAGIQTSPQSLTAPHDVEQETRVYGPASEVVTRIKKRQL